MPMAKMVEVEHYCSDGSMTRRRMRYEKWESLSENLPELDAEFYLAWRIQRHRWNGCKRMTLLETVVPGDFAVDFKEVPSKRCGTTVVPVLVPFEDWVSRFGD